MNIKLLVSAIVSEHNVSVNWCREVAVNFANLGLDVRRVVTIMERHVSVINILILTSLVLQVFRAPRVTSFRRAHTLGCRCGHQTLLRCLVCPPVGNSPALAADKLFIVLGRRHRTRVTHLGDVPVAQRGAARRGAGWRKMELNSATKMMDWRKLSGQR